VALIVAAGLPFWPSLARAHNSRPWLWDVAAQFQWEAYGGADMTGHAWSVYAGTTYAIASDVRHDGFRIRSAAGFGNYSYTSRRWDGTRRNVVGFDGIQASTELLVGYQHIFGPLVVKGFVGGVVERHAITPFDEENEVSGGRYGFKAALETWLTIGERGYLQSELAWSQPFHSYNARLRTGYRLTPAWSIGLEAHALGNAAYDAARIGGFLRLESNWGEISVSGGQFADGDDRTGLYTTIGLMWRF